MSEEQNVPVEGTEEVTPVTESVPEILEETQVSEVVPEEVVDQSNTPTIGGKAVKEVSDAGEGNWNVTDVEGTVYKLTPAEYENFTKGLL